MQVSDKTIEELSHLARLRFNEEEKQSVKNDLQNMIAFVEQLNEIDTTGVEPIGETGSRQQCLGSRHVEGILVLEVLRPQGDRHPVFFRQR